MTLAVPEFFWVGILERHEERQRIVRILKGFQVELMMMMMMRRRRRRTMMTMMMQLLCQKDFTFFARFYQTCKEFGFYQTCEVPFECRSKKDM